MILANEWQSYIVLETGNGEKVEKWGDTILCRPDPQTIWSCSMPSKNKAHGIYKRSSSGGGKWTFTKKLPENWTISYKDLAFKVQPTGFKHTGLFPEQAANWDFIRETIKNSGREIKVLNLFAYTGGATVAAASAGASVCHVDASKGMVQWAKENAVLSGLKDKPIRYIVDDVLKFVLREQRRGNTYHAIIMDPPSYGRGPNGEIWKLENELFSLVKECVKILDKNPLFFIINSYTTGLQASVLKNILELCIGDEFGTKNIIADELGIPVLNQPLVLPCGSTARCVFG